MPKPKRSKRDFKSMVSMVTNGEGARILYMDESLAVFNKSAGEICEDTVQEKDSIVYAFKRCFKNSSFALSVKTPSYIHCFNRLDRPVSGAVLLVFNRNLMCVLQNSFMHAQQEPGKACVTKTYRAIVEGVLERTKDFSLLEHYIRFDSSKQKAFIYDEVRRKTKKASLLWRIRGSGERYSFAEIRLLTGRTHQIRAQLAHIGVHIKGDVKYGARRNDTLGGIRLHAASLEFPHPLTGDRVCSHAPLLQTDALWDVCGKYFDE